MDPKDRMRLALAALIMLVVTGWLILVATRLGVPPQYRENGDIQIDEYARAKDIFVAILPLATTVLGYWFGAAGKEKVEQKAEAATQEADTAKAEAHRARGAITALEANSTSDTVDLVRQRYPEFFE